MINYNFSFVERLRQLVNNICNLRFWAEWEIGFYDDVFVYFCDCVHDFGQKCLDLNIMDGFWWQIWRRLNFKDVIFEILLKENDTKEKLSENGKFRKQRFSAKAILFFCCHSIRNNCRDLKLISNMYYDDF